MQQSETLHLAEELIHQSHTMDSILTRFCAHCLECRLSSHPGLRGDTLGICQSSHFIMLDTVHGFQGQWR